MPKALMSWLALSCASSLLGLGASAGDARPADSRGHRAQGATNSFNVAVPAHSYDLILARPESNSITLSVLAYQDMEGFVAYGPQPGAYTMQTPVRQFKKGVPVELVMGALAGQHPLLLPIPLAHCRRRAIHQQPGIHVSHRAPSGQHLHLHHDGRFAPG